MRDHSKNALYCPLLIRLPLASYSINMNYAEVLDETCIDMNHVHDCYEICFCLENKLAVKVGSRDYVLLPGEFLLIFPGTPHYVVYEPDEIKKYFIMVFELPHSDEYDEKNRPLVTRVMQLSKTAMAVNGSHPVDVITAILSKMEMELHEKKTGWLFLFRGYCVEFLFICFREVLDPVTETPKEEKYLNLAIEITKYLQDNYSAKITLSDIADAFHTSQRHVQRIFSDYFGLSCAKTLNLYRMNYAKNYMRQTSLSVDEIAENVGLASAQSLNRLFQEHELMSVNKYRARQRELAREKLDSAENLCD